MIFQYYSKAQKPRLNYSIGLKAQRAHSSTIGQGVLLYYELTLSIIRRDSDNTIIIFRVT